jgi:hypothetical protein
MTTVRIAHVEPRPGRLPGGGFQTRGYLVVLADDARRRAVPVWLAEPAAGDLARLVELAARPAEEAASSGAPQELAARLLRAAGASVTGVDIDVTGPDAAELRPETAVTRIGLDSAEGARQVTAGLGLGLAMAAAAGAPVRLADAALDRLAAPVPGADLSLEFLDRVPPAAHVVPGRGLPGDRLTAPLPGKRPRFEPRNLTFADGLDRWDFDGGADCDDYSATADGPSAVLSSVVPSPAGPAVLVQAIFADDYRGREVVFSGEIAAAPLTQPAGPRLEILKHWRRVREDHGVTVAGRCDWTRYEVRTLVPEDADLIRFGITLTGAGRIALRHPELRVAR